MLITVELPAWQFEEAGFPALNVGTLMSVALDGGAVILGDETSFGHLRLTLQGQKRLEPIGVGIYALAGVITDVVDYRLDDDVLLEFEIDCGVPVRFTCPTDSEHLPLRGLWTSGLVSLSGLWPDRIAGVTGQPISAILQDVQRCCLRIDEPNFGELRSFDALPPAPFHPDTVFLELRVHGGDD